MSTSITSATTSVTSSLDTSVYRTSDQANFSALTLAIGRGNTKAAKQALRTFRSNISEAGGLTTTLSKRLAALSTALNGDDKKAVNKALRALQTAFDYAIRYPQIQLSETTVRATTPTIEDTVTTSPVTTTPTTGRVVPKATTDTTDTPTTGTLLDLIA